MKIKTQKNYSFFGINRFNFSRFLKTLGPFFLLSWIACTHPISEGVRAGIDPNLKFNQLIESPDSHVGKNVVFGGIIINTRNFNHQTEVEVVQKDLDLFGYPSREDKTNGRFIFINNSFLEPEVYTKGRYITGAGKVKGTRIGKIDKRDYNFPLNEVTELKLWNNYNFSPNSGSYYGPFYPSYFLYGNGRFRNFGGYGPFYLY